ncbi:SMP-30/gluconolactonase/LRE family protein [Amphritea sp.]|uniref:SMP-30/gluconolactonase/LRE family protein n=1 Tax=Amphritea sp. TaxID=1872502 RepID=UPI003A8EC8EE
MIKIFSELRCSLGEGPIWHRSRNSIFWVDINNKKVYEKNIDSDNKYYDNLWEFDLMVSALAVDAKSSNKLWLIAENSIIHFDLVFSSSKVIKNIPIPIDCRTNDASVSPDGKIWFGTMEKAPTGLNGSIYSFDKNGFLTKEIAGVGIPNTMSWLEEDTLYFSDSYEQKMYRYNIKSKEKNVFIDLTKGYATPDGGAFNNTGDLWNAQWDGQRVACYNQEGSLLKAIELLVDRPTSCCYGGKNMDKLFVTSAREGLSNKQLEKHPYSGCLFVLDIGDIGKEVPSFCHSEDLC